MRRIAVIGILCAVIGCCCCQKEQAPGDTVILLGQEAYVKDLTSFIPDSLKTKFPQQFGALPQGAIPPNLEGAYHINNLSTLYSNYNETSSTSEVFLKVGKQHNRVAEVQLFQGNGTTTTDTAYIMGDGTAASHDFTLYLREKKDIEFQGASHRITRLVIFSGEKTGQGIKNLKMGSIILTSDYQETLFVGPFTQGAYFIYQDSDGLSENTDDFPSPTEGGEP